MEAMASGCPVVATAIAGVRELVRDRETGLLVSPGSAGELARAIAALLDDETLRARLTSAARAHVRTEFDVDRSAAQLHALFIRLAGPPERAPRPLRMGSRSGTRVIVHREAAAADAEAEALALR
jgi:glycosyltransferase involved in cell wall biosynthesis